MKTIIRYSILIFMVLFLFVIEGFSLAAAGIFFPDETFLVISCITWLAFAFGYALGLS
jgi:hypothetical protein